MKKIIFIIALSFSFISQAWADSFTAQINRDKVTTDEVFLLTLTHSGKPTSDEPDLSVLKAFNVFSSSQILNQKNDNGVKTYEQEWQLALSSSHSDGKITIPSISLGTLKTSPITLTIDNNISNSEVLTESEGNQKKVETPQHSVQTKVSNENPYVQEQVIYEIILKDTGNLQISEPYFNEESKQDWTIKPFGDPSLNIVNENGKNVREISFHYALFAQKSGKLNLPKAQISGFYIQQDNHNNLNDFHNNAFNALFQNTFDVSSIFARKIPVRLTTPPQNINVLSIPENYSQKWWLPAKKITLSSKWETPKENFKVGEALNRKIFIEAVGLTESQLPNLEFPQIAKTKQYPEKAINTSYLREKNIVTVSEITNVYIPNQTGELTLPEISLTWFNTQTKSFEKATLPAEKIWIKNNPLFEEPTPTTVEDVIADTDILSTQNTAETPSEQTSSKTTDYLLLGGVLFIGIIIGLLAHKHPQKKNATKQSLNNGDMKKNVIQAAQLKDLKLLRESLILWATRRYQDNKILNLHNVMTYTKNKDFEKELEILSATLYAKDIQEWNAKAFIRAFEKENKNRITGIKPNQILPNLYK
ncbi:MAG: BatD family protein [Alphaproteobacteria bacterium]|nr:BatD family protein [Alphaproteobacteria bacterium]